MFVLTIFCIGLAYFFFTLHKSFNTKKTPSVTVQPLELKPLELPQNLILSQKSPLKPKPEQSSLYTIKKIRSKASENSKFSKDSENKENIPRLSPFLLKETEKYIQELTNHKNNT